MICVYLTEEWKKNEGLPWRQEHTTSSRPLRAFELLIPKLSSRHLHLGRKMEGNSRLSIGIWEIGKGTGAGSINQRRMRKGMERFQLVSRATRGIYFLPEFQWFVDQYVRIHVQIFCPLVRFICHTYEHIRTESTRNSSEWQNLSVIFLGCSSLKQFIKRNLSPFTWRCALHFVAFPCHLRVLSEWASKRKTIC